jgi:hypothetical protein
MAPPFNGLIIRASAGVKPGTQVLSTNGTVVAVVPLGAPIEDATCDTVMLHPDDYARLMAKMPKESQ